MLLGFNGATTMKADLIGDVKAASAAGFQALEIWADKMNRYLQMHTVQDLKGLFESHSIRPVSINSIEHIAFRGDEYPRIQSLCQRYSEIAQAIGCDTIVVVPSPKPAGADWTEIRRESLRVLRDLSAIAAEHHISLAFEFLGQTDCSVPTLAHCWEIVAEADLANVGLVLDTFHFFAGGSTLESILEVDPAKILILHINDAEDFPKDRLTDAQRLLPGEGVIPLPEILGRLHTIGFDGLCSIELFRPAYWDLDPAELAADTRSKTLRVLRDSGFDVQ